MSLVEFAEVITIDVEGDPEVDVERRLGDPQDLLTICSSLVSTVYKQVHGEVKEALQFAHFSVREYLGSPRLQDGKFAVQEIRANTFIAESCIVYLRQFDQLRSSLEDCSVPEISKRYPLAEYAATYWDQHARDAGEGGNIISRSKEFFQSEGYALPIWLKLSEWHFPELFDVQGKREPLNCASALDLPKTMRFLIVAGADVNSRNPKSGRTPLMAASYKGRDYAEIVQLLLEHGAEVNLRDRFGDNALILASFNGSVHTVQILLDNGADINAYNKRGFTALFRAAVGCHPETLQRLLDRGASISSPHGDNALVRSSWSGDYESVKILLDRGVNVNAEFGPSFIDHLDTPFSTALLQALSNGHNDTAKLLIEYGADVNARSTVEGLYGIALEHALHHGRDDMVQFLLANGADSSLIRPEDLEWDGKKRYEKLLVEAEGQDQSLRMREEEGEEEAEAKEPHADSYF